jgi:glutathione synthase/RimK-type ligase-like ATP-grasp enzyme
MIKLALAFGKTFEDYHDPFETLGEKRPVYQELLDRIKDLGWDYYVVSTSTYKGNGVFEGYWDYSKKNDQPKISKDLIKVDIVYDRSGGLKFPSEKEKLAVVDNLAFKKLAWDKWLAYQEIGEFMPKTYWVGEQDNLKSVLPQIKTDYVVLKPHNGLKGRGIFIGKKDDAYNFEFLPEKPVYIAQEFVDTSAGIPKLTPGKHDLRVVIINKIPVWSHIRIPPEGTLTANVARGGNLVEVDVDTIPSEVVKIVEKVAKRFYNNYDNPVYSLDFGLENGQPKIFEVNDQIGFPRVWMKAKDTFLEELIKNFKSKI